MNINQSFISEKFEICQNWATVYICGFPFVMDRINAQNRLALHHLYITGIMNVDILSSRLLYTKCQKVIFFSFLIGLYSVLYMLVHNYQLFTAVLTFPPGN